LTRAIELIPEEPAAWANRGLFYLRTNQPEKAAPDLERARQMAPDNLDIQKLLGLLAQRRGQFGEAAAQLRKAVERDPRDVETVYRVAQVLAQESQEGSDTEYLRLMEQILAVQPNNLYVLEKRLTVAVRSADRDAVRDTLARFKRLAPGWSERSRAALADLENELAGQLGPDAVF